MMSDVTEGHIFKRFNLELAKLRNRVMDMGDLAAVQLRQLHDAVTNGRTADMQEVAEGETALDLMEIKVDKLIVRLLARRGPMGADLRFIIAASRMVNDLERLGDETSFMGRQLMADAAEYGQCQGVQVYREIGELIDLAHELLQRVLAAFAQQDEGAARELAYGGAGPEGELGLRIKRLSECLVVPDVPPQAAVNRMLAARALDRILGLISEMAEHVIFLTTGKDVRHRKYEPEQP